MNPNDSNNNIEWSEKAGMNREESQGGVFFYNFCLIYLQGVVKKVKQMFETGISSQRQNINIKVTDYILYCSLCRKWSGDEKGVKQCEEMIKNKIWIESQKQDKSFEKLLK